MIFSWWGLYHRGSNDYIFMWSTVIILDDTWGVIIWDYCGLNWIDWENINDMPFPTVFEYV